jgi:D-glycero-D-manno-heptose 1,7-bisphosphate phosphatase
LRAAADFGIDLARSYMIGDKPEDIAFGQNIGATSVLVLTGQGWDSRRRLRAQGQAPGHVAADILAAVRWIILREKGRR